MFLKSKKFYGFLLLILFGLTACGQSGPLYLPKTAINKTDKINK